MHLPLGITPSGRASAAEELLGRDHPLAHAEESVRWLGGQVVAVALLLLGSAVALVAGAAGIVGVTGAAALVLVLLAVALLIASSSRRERALELIAAGRAGLPLAAVQREVRRLADPRRAVAFSTSLDRLRREATLPYRDRPLHRPVYVPAVIREVDGDLARIAGQLRASRADLAALARVECLLSSGRSPLYEADARRLRDELRRIQFSL